MSAQPDAAHTSIGSIPLLKRWLVNLLVPLG